MIEIIPAIDLIEGRCVRLSQGDYDRQRTYDASPLDIACQFADAGIRRLHLVDLDGAKAARPCNLHVLEAIASATDLDIEWGGGIKDRETLSNVFSAGAGHAICGSIAIRQPDDLRAWLEDFGGERIILGADVREGRVAVGGWLEDSAQTVDALIDTFLPHGLSEVICTDISRDGMLTGPSFDLYTRLQAAYPAVTFTVSGGISSVDDIRRLDALGLPRVIVGKAFYEGHITLSDLSSFKKSLR